MVLLGALGGLRHSGSLNSPPIGLYLAAEATVTLAQRAIATPSAKLVWIMAAQHVQPGGLTNDSGGHSSGQALAIWRARSARSSATAAVRAAGVNGFGTNRVRGSASTWASSSSA